MKKQQIKCPACGSFKTVDIKTSYLAGGGCLMVFCIPLVILFFFLILPIIFFLVGLLVLGMGLAMKDNVRMKCNSCGFLFPKK
jgi:hypothetical protein